MYNKVNKNKDKNIKEVFIMKVLGKLFLVLIMIFALSFAFACSKDETDDNKQNNESGEKLEKIKVMIPGGAPLMALAGVYKTDEFEIEVVNGAENLQAALMGSEYDMVIAPLNLGAKFHTLNKTSFKLDAIITTNNTYIVSKNSVDVNDLKGAKILAYGQNATPDIVLKAANQKYNLGLEFEYMASANDVTPLFIAGDESANYILSAYPQITQIKNKVSDANVLNVVSLFGEDEVFPQACLFVNSKTGKDYSKHLELIKNNINLLNEKPAEYAQSVVSKHAFLTGLGTEVLTEALPKTNIVYLKAKDNKDKVNNYIDLLNTYAPKLLEGKTVSEEFYN